MAESAWTVAVVVVLLGVALLGALAVLVRHRGRSRWPAEPTVAEALAPPPFPGAAPRPGLPDADPEMSGVDAGPYPGSAVPGPDGAAPSDRFVVQAVEADRRYHGPGERDSGRVRADVWFLCADDAERAGFRPAAPRDR